jgi:hypothetical protein
MLSSLSLIFKGSDAEVEAEAETEAPEAVVFGGSRS